MWDLIVRGQLFMWPLLLCSVFAVAVMIERWTALRAARKQSLDFLSRFDRLVHAGDLAGARRLCHAERNALADMMLAGLERFEELGRERDIGLVYGQVSERIVEQGKYTVAELEAHLGVLATVATLAPLLGFAGTVTGMIRAFDAIAAANDISPSIVASGIAEALITTAAGLMIAMPTVAAFNYFTKQVESLTLSMEASANGLLRKLFDETRRNIADATGDGAAR